MTDICPGVGLDTVLGVSFAGEEPQGVQICPECAKEFGSEKVVPHHHLYPGTGWISLHPPVGDIRGEHVRVRIVPIPGRENTFYLFGLETEEEYRGKGLATKFMKAILEEHDKAGSIIVGYSAKPELWKWYREMGFVHSWSDSDEFGHWGMRKPSVTEACDDD